MKLSRGSKQIVNYVMKNLDADTVKVVAKMVANFTLEQTDALVETMSLFGIGSAKYGFKKGLFYGGLAATSVISAYSYYCYKKSQKNSEDQQEL